MIPGVDDFREPWGTKRFVPASPHRVLVPGRAVIKCVKCQYWISPLIPGWNTTCAVFSSSTLLFYHTALSCKLLTVI